MPVRDLLLDDDWDLALVNGDLAFVADRTAVKQGIKVREQMFRGEVWLNQAIGVPWLDTILIANPNGLQVRQELRAPVLDTPDVVSCTAESLDVDPATRHATAVLSFTDIYESGPATVAATV